MPRETKAEAAARRVRLNAKTQRSRARGRAVNVVLRDPAAISRFEAMLETEGGGAYLERLILEDVDACHTIGT